MRNRTITFTEHYTEYDPAERVRAREGSYLPPGEYTVTKFYPPCNSLDPGTVFLEGKEHGVGADDVIGLDASEVQATMLERMGITDA